MDKPLLISQASLLAFLTCHRRFYLRYLERLPWPELLLKTSQRPSVERGQKFHQLLERFFLGLPVDPTAIRDTQLRAWWRRFQESELALPQGRRLPELRITVPAGPHFLIGRFDLVIVSTAQDHPFAHVYDWKTSRPRTHSELQQEWQTRLYLAMLAESSSALTGDEGSLDANQISLTYWYVDEPLEPRTITYSQEQHKQNWIEIQELVGEIELGLDQDQWPLTDNWSHCRTCAYQAYCGRQEAGASETLLAEDPRPYDFEPDYLLEPETP
jgi:CRISPR/Cas system-associated exonuclease Cas4 (RecB family)